MAKRKTFRKFGGAGDIVQIPDYIKRRNLNYPPGSDPLYSFPIAPFPPDYDEIPQQHGYNDGVDVTKTLREEVAGIVNYNRKENPEEADKADTCKNGSCSVMGGRTKRNRRRRSRKSRRNRKGGAPIICPKCGSQSYTTMSTINGPIYKCTECGTVISTPWD